MDFCYGYLQFPSLYLSIPGGLSLDLKKYWNGQPVRFTCCERNKEAGRGPGKDLFCIVFELVEDEDDEEEGGEEGGQESADLSNDID